MTVTDEGAATDGALAADAALAGALVREAGELAASMQHQDLGITRKGGVTDVVTDADRAAEELVVTRLARARPADGVLAEEGSARPAGSGRTWVVDPLDGTDNFRRGLDWWCSALALVDADGEPVLGAVHHPGSGRTLVGGPAWATTRDERPLPPPEDVPLSRAGVATYLHPPHTGGPAAAFARAVQDAATVRMLGSSSMDAVAVAEGRLAVTFQHTVADWDRLPGWALVRGVGGATRQVRAGGVLWSVAGVPTAVGDVVSALGAGPPDGAGAE